MNRQGKVYRPPTETPGTACESLAAAALDSLTSPIAILDADGVILHTNLAWRRFAGANGMAADTRWIGVNYLSICDSAGEANTAADGIRAVLGGQRSAFEMIYACHAPEEKRWYAMQVTRVADSPAGSVVVAHHDVSALKLTEEALTEAHCQAQATARALAESERFIKTIVDNLPGLVAYWDKDLRCRFANQPYLQWFGRRPETMLGVAMQDIVEEHLFAQYLPYVHRVLAGQRQQFERPIINADGSVFYSWVTYIPDSDENGQVAGFFVQVSDLAAQSDAHAERELATCVYQNTGEGIVVTDANQVILSVNPAFTEISGYSAEEAIGQTPHMLKSNHHDAAFYAAMWRQLQATGRWQGEIFNRRKSGEVFPEWQTITMIRNVHGEPVRYVAVFHDLTVLRRKDERLRHLAFHDALTDLPNRTLLLERLQHLLTLATSQRRTVALLFLDLDRFKQVNDTLGHDVGDALLQIVAQRLLEMVRCSDTVARLGGDEFVVLLDNPASQYEVTHIASRMITAINAPMALRNTVVQVGISIGIALHSNDAQSPAQLLKNADTAMYAAKAAGKNCYRFFVPAMQHDLQVRPSSQQDPPSSPRLHRQ